MNKFMLLLLLLFSVLWGLSSSSWFSLWVALEINSMMLMPLMMLKVYQQYTESTMKYFLIQSISSLLFIMCTLLMNNSLWMFMELNLIMNFIMISMFMKIGMFPFIFWYVEIITKISFLGMKLIMTVQKILPMIIINMMFNKNSMLFFLVMINMLISSIIAMNQINMKKILSLSSINQMGWMMMSLILNYSTFIIYLITYSFILFIIIKFMKMYSIKSMIQMFCMNNLFMSFSIMSMSGLPPFSGFIMKWMIIMLMMDYNMIMLTIIMIISSMISLYFYMRLIMISFMMTFMKMKWIIKNNYNFKLNYLNLNALLSLFLIPFLNFIYMII
uniref:NADH-ubiquinone oxidoreductase chain 2 n=1 Tax=Ammothea hilgendorfi TaxID=258330 RepID=E0XLF3_AMMHI|nr:NADH dehydrogenase subunit 2 [Ammothea hilgendorfi]